MMVLTLRQTATTVLPVLFLLAGLFWPTATIPFSATDIEDFHLKHYLINRTIRSWEEGVWTQALLEVHNPELTVFAADPFPHGHVPQIPQDVLSKVPGLAGAATYIQVNGTLLCDGGGSPADPASLGSQAVLLSHWKPQHPDPFLPSARAYGDAAKRQAQYLVHNATKYHLNATHAAISHRDEPPELWGDFIYMVPPFLAYYGVAINSTEFLKAAVQQCQVYNDALATNITLSDGLRCSALWRHIISQPSRLSADVCCTDPYVWLTSNAWAIAGMTRVLATLKPWTAARLSIWTEATYFDVDDAVASLTSMLDTMLVCMMAQSRDEQNDLLKNYLDGPGQESEAWAFGDAAGTALVTSAIYRLAVLVPEVFAQQKYVSWADQNLVAVAKHVHEDGRVGPVAQINGVPSKEPVESTSEGQSMALLLYAARRDFLKSQNRFAWLRAWS